MYLFIHRKDLRTSDLRLFDVLRGSNMQGLHTVILDPRLIDGRLTSHSCRNFLLQAARLDMLYRQQNRKLYLLYGDPAEVVTAIAHVHPLRLTAVHADHTPYAIERDARMRHAAETAGAVWLSEDDLPLADLGDFQTYTARNEPYKVFTPFYRKWNSYIRQFFRPSSQVSLTDLPENAELDRTVTDRFALPPLVSNALQALREEARSSLSAPEAELRRFVKGGPLTAYSSRRDSYADIGSTSGLSRFLNTGALSARQIYQAAAEQEGSESWLRQLAWRDFYLYQAVYHQDFFRYEQLYDFGQLSDRHLEAWTSARTGIPIIDAAMTQLRETGELPNRLRMITAMFLTKNLLCPFPLGEQYFRSSLNDYDNTLNRGGWLWSSSLGYDPSPYFRIMNPVTQSMKHDPEGQYIRRWLPELRHLAGRDLHAPRPQAIVDLKASRARAIEVYRTILR
ncbi:cryptochrome/photolyase family protein [Paenibacillus tarimensis]|uniref:cryptochrome/photolyase family protein n=1 Tax=Paenibacillus tarimensis TaxID=416012 RepID=UPI001F41A7F8|nr:deoxyribodipyrimidine photo-lyase [Paenibacillus tarimensis]MCF2945836.1 DNA photolyase family protein [Paenibacillus tarimensis]